MGIPPIAGWFVMDLNGQSQSKMDEEQGYPHDLGNLHIETPCVWSIQIRIHPKDGRCAVIFGFKGYPLVNSPTKLWNITSPFLLGKLSISMAIFNSYVSLPEGISFGQTYVLPDGREKGKPWPAISIRIWECEPTQFRVRKAAIPQRRERLTLWQSNMAMNNSPSVHAGWFPSSLAKLVYQIL